MKQIVKVILVIIRNNNRSRICITERKYIYFLGNIKYMEYTHLRVQGLDTVLLIAVITNCLGPLHVKGQIVISW